MTKAIFIILTLAGFASGAEMEVTDRLSVDGSSIFKNTALFSGSVGIGTTNPTSTLYVQYMGSGNGYLHPLEGVVIRNTENSGLYEGPGLSFSQFQSGSEEVVGRIATIRLGYPAMRMAIMFRNGGSGTGNFANTDERISITGSGNVGIGTPSPGAKLDVNGTANATGYNVGGVGGWTGSFVVGMQEQVPEYALDTTGSGGSAHANVSASSDWNFGSGDYTLECWIYWTQTPVSGTDDKIFDNQNNFRFGFKPGVTMGGENFSGVNWWSPGFSITANVWHHAAWVRSGNTAYVFFDGNLQGSTSVTGSLDGSSGFAIGARPDGGEETIAWIDEVRFSNIGRYTSSFTPSRRFGVDSNTKLLLHFDGDLTDSAGGHTVAHSGTSIGQQGYRTSSNSKTVSVSGGIITGIQ